MTLPPEPEPIPTELGRSSDMLAAADRAWMRAVMARMIAEDHKDAPGRLAQVGRAEVEAMAHIEDCQRLVHDRLAEWNEKRKEEKRKRALGLVLEGKA